MKNKKLIKGSHKGIRLNLPANNKIKKTIIIIRFIIIAGKPNVMIISLKYGTASTLSGSPFTGFFNSAHLK